MPWKVIVIVIVTASIVANFIPTPLELQKAFISGQNFYASGDYRKAIRQYDYIISTESKFLNEDSVRVELFNGDLVLSVKTAAYYQKANALKRIGEIDEAIKNFRIVADERTDSPWLSALSQYQIADIYYEAGKFREAIAEARKLIEKFPDDERVPRAYYTIGWAFKELNQIDSSTLNFEILIEEFPSSSLVPNAMFQIAQNYYNLGKWDIALRWYIDITERFRPETFKEEEFKKIELKAVRERKIFEATAGREAEETALEIVAKSSLRIADCYKQLGQFNNAIDAYRKVISTYTLLPSLIETAYIKMAQYMMKERGLEAGISVYREAIDRHFDDKQLQAKMQYLIARSYQDSLQYAKAADEYDFYIRAYKEVALLIDFPVEDAIYSKVICLYNAERYSDVVMEVDSFITKYSTSSYVPDMLFFKGISHLSLGEYDKAEASFKYIISNFSETPQYLPARVQLGRTYYEAKRYDDAVNELTKLLSEARPGLDTSEVNYYLVLIYFDKGEYEKIMSAFAGIKPGSKYYVPAFIKVSKAFSMQKKFDEGERFIKSIMKIAESMKDSIYFIPEVHFSLADIYIGKERYRDAIDELTLIIEDRMANEILKIQSRYARGVLYNQIGLHREAVEDLEFVLSNEIFLDKFQSLIPGASERLALSYVKSGRISDGIKLISKLIDETPEPVGRARYSVALAEVYYEVKDYRKAIKFANDVFQTDIADEGIYSRAIYVAVNSHRELGEFEKVLSILTKSADKFPNSNFIQDAFFSIGASYYDKGEYEYALEILDRYVKRFPNTLNYKFALFFRAYSYFRLGYWHESADMFRDFVRRFPDDELTPEAQYNIGESFYNMGKYLEAAGEYRIVYKRFPGNELAPLAIYSEGWCYFELGEPEKMINLFEELVKRYPDSEYAPIAMFTIGDYYYNQKRYSDAQTAYEKFIERYPNHRKVEEARQLIRDLKLINAYAEYQEAMKYFDNRDYHRAIEELKKVWEKYPDTDIVVGCRVNIAASYEQIGDFRRAARMYEEIIRDYQNSTDDNARAAVIFAREHLEWLKSNFNF
jgi:tetratricopeptide (TPR) repeat protein